MDAKRPLRGSILQAILQAKLAENDHSPALSAHIVHTSQNWNAHVRDTLLIIKETDDVDLKERCATLRGVKNSRNPGKILDVPVGLSPRALEILKSLPRSLDGRVFPITANALKCTFNRAQHKLGFDHFRFHDARHERISSLIEAGWSDTQVMAQPAHRDPKSLKRYANLRQKFLADALAAIRSRRSKAR